MEESVTRRESRLVCLACCKLDPMRLARSYRADGNRNWSLKVQGGRRRSRNWKGRKQMPFCP